MRFRMVSVICVCLLLVCGSWGFLVHRTIHQLAVYQLPKPLQPFFYENMDYLVRYSVRPDQRRNKDTMEASKHFIDLEPLGDSAAWKMPMTWEEAVTKYPEDTLLKYGYVPYWILTMKGKLTAAFKTGNRDSILFYAADLGHYIGDAHVPLHTSVNYDGQLSNQKGLHSLWESFIPELEISQYDLSSNHKAQYLKDPSLSIWNAVRQAHGLVKDVFEKEREVSKNFTDSTKYRVQMRNGREVRSYTTAFARAYAQSLAPTINEQLLRASHLIADFWYTAWADAGKPSLDGLLKQPYTGEKKEKFKSELKVYKKNALLEKGLLLSKKQGSED